jgi:xylulokinase
MAPKIRWLKEHANPTRFHQPVTYLVERLCGEAVIDPALASTTMLFSLADRMWAQDLLDAFEIEARELPRIAPTCSIAGTITAAGAERTGLRVGTPVAVGTGDDFCTPLGAGLIDDPRVLVCAIGTAEVVCALGAVDRRRRFEPMVETNPSDRPLLTENPAGCQAARCAGTARWAPTTRSSRSPPRHHRVRAASRSSPRSPAR